MKKHANLSFFVPHLGCKHKCVFCDQNNISGAAHAPSAQYVRELCESRLGDYPADMTEIAFFGGSFTAIERGYMTELLDTAYSFVRDGRACGIRLSTRPDAIDDEILSILKSRGVTVIELGAQSMDDTVLSLNERGHTSEDVVRAAHLIKQHGFSLGLQMMTGMYGDKTPFDTAVMTAQRFIDLSPDCVRIYPTLVVANTRLARLYEQGDYVPLTTDEAAEITANLLEMFYSASIDVIRIGLHDDSSLRSTVIAGPRHSAFGELCMSKVFQNKLSEELGNHAKATVLVAPDKLSAAIGQKRANALYFSDRGVSLTFAADDTLTGYDIKIIGE